MISMRKVLYFFLLISTLFSFKTKKPVYVLYNSKGNKVSFKKMVSHLKSQNIVMFGELHNNPIAHWLEIEITQELRRFKHLTLGGEMFESDHQKALDLYLQDSISIQGLDSLARLWSNFYTDYKPLVDYAKKHQLNFIATNIPGRFASAVYKQGGFMALDSLSEREKSWVAPLPIAFDPNLPNYQAILKMMGKHGSPNIVKAQASRDATMAHFILKNYSKDHLFLHFNGAYHSNNYEGIVWYIKNQNSELKLGTISTVCQNNINKLEETNKGLADFIIVVDEDVTTSY